MIKATMFMVSPRVMLVRVFDELPHRSPADTVRPAGHLGKVLAPVRRVDCSGSLARTVVVVFCSFRRASILAQQPFPGVADGREHPYAEPAVDGDGLRKFHEVTAGVH